MELNKQCQSASIIIDVSIKCARTPVLIAVQLSSVCVYYDVIKMAIREIVDLKFVVGAFLYPQKVLLTSRATYVEKLCVLRSCGP
jgi:hypothetical protein